MRAVDWFLLIILSLLWGGTFFFVGVALHEVPPMTLVLARVGIAALALVPLVLVLGLRFPSTRHGWVPFLGMSILNNVIPFSLLFIGQTRIASGLASVLNATTPLFAILVVRAFGGDRLNGSKLAGIVLGILGVALLIGPSAFEPGAGRLMGMLCVLGAAVSYAFSGVWGRRLSAVSPVLSSAGQLACSTALLLPIAAAVDQPWTLPQPSAHVVAAVLALALVSTAAAYLIFFRILATSGPVNVMLVTLLIPVSAIALGALFLGERLESWQVAGAVVIASALVVIDGRLLPMLARKATAA